MARYAAIDCGTNSLRLLISEDNHGRPREIVRLMEIVRLGQGVDATGEFAPEALERTRKVLTNTWTSCSRSGYRMCAWLLPPPPVMPATRTSFSL